MFIAEFVIVTMKLAIHENRLKNTYTQFPLNHKNINALRGDNDTMDKNETLT